MTNHVRTVRTIRLAAAIFILTTAPALADTLHVPSQYDTIQEAIDAALPGDAVEIADGTYTGEGNRSLIFRGKAITVRSASGDPELCVIDCEGGGANPGVSFHNGEGPDTILRGVKVINADHRISEWLGGGGISCYYDSSPTIIDCILSGNKSNIGGGGICCYENCNPTLTNCTITENDSGIGGAVFSYESNPRFTNCTFDRNESLIMGNISLHGGSPTLVNCRVCDNAGDCGIYCASSSPTITNCTIKGNSGGGLLCEGEECFPTLTNSILWGNPPLNIDASVAAPVVTYCCVQGGWVGEGNIDAEPFVFPDVIYLTPGSPCIDAGTNDPPDGLPADDLDGNPRPLDGDGDTVAIADMGAFEFNPLVPLIIVGPATSIFHGPEGGDDPPDQTLSLRNCGGGTLAWEITGQPAWLTISPTSGESSGEADLVTLSVDTDGLSYGVHRAELEVDAPTASNSPRQVHVVLYVNTTLLAPSEFPTIRAAINAALPGDTVVLADGTYTGAGNKDLDFAGKALTVRSASGDPASCIIDCEGYGRGFYFDSFEGPDSIIEGLTIANGRAGLGGGVYCKNSSPTLAGCTISDCTAGPGALARGGGVYCDFNSSPKFICCTIRGNSADHDGGGVYSGVGGSPTIINCMINGNAALFYGGGVSCEDSGLTLTNCTISGNSAVNQYGSGGGVACFNDVNPTFTNCTISGNSAALLGGGVFCSNSSPELMNCILRGDTPQEIYVYLGAPVVTYSNVQNGAGELWFGDGCIDADPLFVDPDGPDGDPYTWEDNDYRLGAGSPCIDAGDNDAVPAWLSMDLDARLRFADRIDTPDTGAPGAVGTPLVDMGSYEYQCTGDLNGDGAINLSDLAELLAHYGAADAPAYADGDLDQDEDVDLSDLTALLSVYGDVCP